MTPKLFVLSLDGMPFTFLQKALEQGRMPHLQKWVNEGVFKQMDSVQPPLSSSAWASFATGRNPAEHGIMGFTERNPATMDWFVTNAAILQGQTLWQKLSQSGKRIFVMNVPLTYPPQKVNGIMISGFLAPDLKVAAFPQALGTLLKARSYVIDADTELARKDLTAFYEHLNRVLDKRLEIMWHFFEQERWDFFMTHIMESDRLHHFFWEYMENGHPVYSPLFYKFYAKIDRLLGSLRQRLPNDGAVLLLSDHGFGTLKKEAYINEWLRRNGWLQFKHMPPQSLKDLHPQSLAYSLYPGRIYLNVQGREAQGSIKPGLEYEKIRQQIRRALLAWRDEQGQFVIKEVRSINELYGRPERALNGTIWPEPHPHLPDLIAIAHKGFDLKGHLWNKTLFDKTVFNGMHTFNDAFVLSRGFALPAKRLAITGLFNLIIQHMKTGDEKEN